MFFSAGVRTKSQRIQWDPWLTISGTGYLVNYYNGTLPSKYRDRACVVPIRRTTILCSQPMSNLLMKGDSRRGMHRGIIACVVGIRSLMYFGFAVDHFLSHNAFEDQI